MNIQQTVTFEQILFDLSLEIKKVITIRFIDKTECSKFIPKLNSYNRDKISCFEAGNRLIIRLAKNDSGITLITRWDDDDYLHVKDNEFIRV